MGVFFDAYPAFYESSRTAAFPRRLELRHRAIIEANRDILDGARVLDLASHDGRWSFAALKAGARHVTGVEARAGLVESSNKLFAQYGVPDEDYRFVQGDMFRILRERRFEIDVVLCLGFVYHTLRYGELLRGIADAGPAYCILDTKVHPSDEPLVRVLTNKTAVQGHAAEDELSAGGLALAGYPSVAALELMLDVYDFEVEAQYDWATLLATLPERVRAVRGYETGNRVTLRCRSRRR
jgi:hypothetical protein